jgi:hypothetical protein
MTRRDPRSQSHRSSTQHPLLPVRRAGAFGNPADASTGVSACGSLSGFSGIGDPFPSNRAPLAGSGITTELQWYLGTIVEFFAEHDRSAGRRPVPSRGGWVGPSAQPHQKRPRRAMLILAGVAVLDHEPGQLFGRLVAQSQPAGDVVGVDEQFIAGHREELRGVPHPGHMEAECALGRRGRNAGQRRRAPLDRLEAFPARRVFHRPCPHCDVSSGTARQVQGVLARGAGHMRDRPIDAPLQVARSHRPVRVDAGLQGRNDERGRSLDGIRPDSHEALSRISCRTFIASAAA